MTDSGVPLVARACAAIVALPLAAFALLVGVNQVRTGFDAMGICMSSGPAAVAFLAGWFALRGHIAESRERMRLTLLGGIALGGIGLVAGVFGPILLTPEANQGPLLGILFTGPLGFAVGTAAGFVYSQFRRGSR